MWSKDWFVARQTSYGPVKISGPYGWFKAQLRRGPGDVVVRYALRFPHGIPRVEYGNTVTTYRADDPFWYRTEDGHILGTDPAKGWVIYSSGKEHG